ncbi:MAG TPA: hypothetical protein VFW87_00335 [Pirellulales bacterium]|nr:hypothetical protein [Pirellulales bacterium]
MIASIFRCRVGGSFLRLQIAFEFDAAEIGFLFVEVHKQPDPTAGGFEIRPESGIVVRAKVIDCFCFKNYPIGDEHVEPVQTHRMARAVDHDFLLDLEPDTALG